MAEITTLHDAVRELVPDGAVVAMEGFTHLIPHAAGHEIIRQGKRELTLVRMTPDIIYDQMIGMGCARKLVFSWGGNPGVGSLHRFRDAVERGHPLPLGIEEHSHAGMAARYVAGASGLPFAALRGYLGTDLSNNTTIRTVTCPFTGEELAAVPALNPDVTVIHAQQADKSGNISMWGITGVQREAVLAARVSIVTVEEVVESFDLGWPNQVTLPGWAITAVAPVPGGAHPSYAMGYTSRDNRFYADWDELSRDRQRFADWMRLHVLEQPDFSGYLATLAIPGGSQVDGG